MKISAIKFVRKESVAAIAAEAYQMISGGYAALSGGSTYRKVLDLWSSGYDFSGVEFFPVDERVVSFSSPDSNWGSAERLFFSKRNDKLSTGNFAESYQSYKRLIHGKLISINRVFDTVFLGVGDDGHTASLFPGGAYLSDYESAVLKTESPLPPKERITLGPRMLISAGTVIVIIIGEGKREVLKRILSGDKSLPIVQILDKRKESFIYTDIDYEFSTE